jgi:hypothetical protein
MNAYKHIGGARLWCDWTRFPTPLKDRLYEFVGTGSVRGEMVWQFIPYKRPGHPVLRTYDELARLMPHFKPFCISTDAFNAELNGGPNAG